MQTIIKYNRAYNIVNKTIVIFVQKNLEISLRKNIRYSNKTIIVNNLAKQLDKIIQYYNNLKNNQKKSIYNNQTNKKKITF